jgi:hypothetical protein
MLKCNILQDGGEYITRLTSPSFFWHVLQFYLLPSNLECCKSTMALVGNYAVANGLPNRIPNKGHLNFVLHDMQRMVVQQQKKLQLQ